MTTRGPIDEGEWPSRLTGMIAEPGARRIHGYSVDADLARHYSAGAVTLLTLTGELSQDSVARAFELASIFLSPVHAGEAPAHAAGLTRLMGASTSAVIGNAAIALAEEARFLVSQHEALLSWLTTGGEFPTRFVASSDAERAASSSLSARLEELELRTPIFHAGVVPTPNAAAIGVLFACGLTDADRLQAAIVLARLPCALAEGFSTRPGHFKKYAMNTPIFEYEEDGGE